MSVNRIHGFRADNFAVVGREADGDLQREKGSDAAEI